LPVPPLGGTPRLPALHDRLPRKRPTAAGPRRRSFVEPLTSTTPCEAGWRPGPSRSSVWPSLTDFRRREDRPRRNWLSPPAPAS